MTLCYSPKCSRVIIYDHKKVSKALSQVPPWVFSKLGYPHGIDPTLFLEEVRLRWQERGKVPDEIGLALGYPLKDVMGYMGVVSLPCTGACGWRIYGDLKPSLRMSREFEKAKQQAAALMETSAG
jgi:hypothetical protein